ncbi:MAG: hypothetical protein ACRDS0_38210 [Pseudonocardiaceae bacterium]
MEYKPLDRSGAASRLPTCIGAPHQGLEPRPIPQMVMVRLNTQKGHPGRITLLEERGSWKKVPGAVAAAMRG